MPVKHAAFDMDGTLVCSHKTIYHTMMHTLKLFNVEKEIPEEEFNKLIGHHFGDIFPLFGIYLDDVEEFINEFKKHYFEYIDDSYLYPGVVEILEELKKRGIKVSVVTTKAQEQVEKILRHFSINQYFNCVMGRRPGINHKPSPEPLLIACCEIGVKPEDSLIIGDAELDVQCGKAAGAKTVSVTYGYREKEILALEEPDFIIDNLISLKYIIQESNTF